MQVRTKPLLFFNVGFPKSGTSTLQTSVMKAGLKSVHWHSEGIGYIGRLMYKRLYEGVDPLADFHDFDAVTQADLCKDGANYWPQFDDIMLRRIRFYHPSAYMILNYRDPEKVVSSIEKWGDLQQRLTAADVPGLPKGKGSKRSELLMWVNWCYEATRARFAHDARFFEYSIEDPLMPGLLADKLGINLTWWGKANSNPDGKKLEKLKASV